MFINLIRQIQYNINKNNNNKSYLIFGLECLKNCKNLGMRISSGLFCRSSSKYSDESSHIFCRAPKAPYYTP